MFNFKLNLAFAIICVSNGLSLGKSKGNLSETNQKENLIPCVFVPGLYLGSRQRELECCNETVETYELNWVTKRAYLTRYLRTLKAWKCPQYKEECDRKTFAYNSYGKNVYDYFCDHPKLVNNCYSSVTDVVNRKQNLDELSPNPTLRANQWSLLMKRVKSLRFSIEDLRETCLQVALYETGDKLKFQEIKNIEIPTCDLIWGGFDAESVSRETISMWSITNIRCRVNIVIIDVVCAILAFVITIVNVTVIGVFLTNPGLRHSQGIYKTSLAVADLLVGTFLFPTFIVSLWIATQTPLEPYESDLPSYINGTPSVDELQQLNDAIPYQEVVRYSVPYLDFVGFFTSTSLTVSIYSLTVAGLDRLVAVYRPLRYHKDSARVLAVRLSVIIWCVAIVFAALPMFVPSLNYALVVSFFTSLAGRDALILYSIAFAIPLLVMWVVSVATYCYTQKHGKIRRNMLKSSSAAKVRSVENKLARTLLLMVGAFTMSLVPAIVLLVSTLFIPTIHPHLPRFLVPETTTAVIGVEMAVFMLIACNSLWNFFIYNGRNVEFRKAVRRIVRRVAKKTGLRTCSDSLGLCCRRVAYHGRRRLSSFPTISGLSGDRKKSSTSEQTISVSQVVSQAKVDSATDNLVLTSGPKYSTTELASSKSGEDHTRATEVLSAVSSGDKKRKKKGRGDFVRDDSIFRSFAIDANASHLFESVMDDIDEEVFCPTGKKFPRS